MASKVILLVYFFGVALAQIRMTATFDDLSFARDFMVPIGGANFPPSTPYVYKSLAYTNWYQGTSRTPTNASSITADGLIPASQPNVIGSSQYKPDQSDPSNYPAKRIAVAAPYRSFDLLSFSYGCSLLTTTIASSCAIAVTGTYANGQQVPAASFNYFRGQLSQSGMFLAQLPDYYRGLREVVVGVASGEDGTGPTEQVLDSLVYNVNF